MYLEFVHVLKALTISVKNMPIKLTFYLTLPTGFSTLALLLLLQFVLLV